MLPLSPKSGGGGAEEPWRRSLQELYTTAPSYKRSPRSPGARVSHPTSSQATTLLLPSSYLLSMVFFFKKNFLLYYFTPGLYDYGKPVDSSAKTQTN